MKLGRTTLLVEDYEEAIAFYCDRLGFTMLHDQEAGPGLRFVHIGLPEQENVGLWLLKADGPKARSMVGNQSGGSPFLVLYTEDLQRNYAKLTAKGVAFHEGPSDGDGSRHAQFRDLYGNTIVLVELKEQRDA